jgi:hypothetical protein
MIVRLRSKFAARRLKSETNSKFKIQMRGNFRKGNFWARPGFSPGDLD